MTRSVGVVVCAYTTNRWADIVRAVGSIQAQSPAPAQIVLVVDHNDKLLAMVRRRWPELTAVANTGPRGLSGARNTGVALCSTDIVAFLDDDAAARPGWLASMTAAFADPSVVATGARALPVWPDGRAPATLPPELLWVVGCTYRGQPEQTADVRNIMGCAMAFRRSVLDEIGGFADGIGRIGTVPLGCEETELCIRARQRDAHARVVFEPAAVVEHRVSAARTGWSYLARRSYAEGLSKAAIGRLVGAGDALSSERAYTRSVLPRGVLRELRRGHPASAAAIVVSLACATAGYLRGLRATPVQPGPAERGRPELEVVA